LFIHIAELEVQPQVMNEPTPESIFSKAIQSIGGRRALEKIDSFQLHGVMRLADERPVIEIDLSTSKGGKVLGIMTYIGLGQSRFGSNGTIAWEQIFKATQEYEWSIIDQSVLSQKVRQINWLEWFTMLPAKLKNIEFDGEEEFGNEKCWKLIIQEDDGREQHAFFSQSTFRPKGRTTIEKTPNGDATIHVYFKDWQRVGDLLLFHTVVYDRDGSLVTLKLNKISIEPILDSFFDLPPEVKLLIKEQ
jgi:hypothetical protein